MMTLLTVTLEIKGHTLITKVKTEAQDQVGNDTKLLRSFLPR